MTIYELKQYLPIIGQYAYMNACEPHKIKYENAIGFEVLESVVSLNDECDFCIIEETFETKRR